MNTNQSFKAVSDTEYLIRNILNQSLADTKNSSTRKLNKDGHTLCNAVNTLLFSTYGTLMSAESINLLKALKSRTNSLNYHINNLTRTSSYKSMRNNKKKIKKLLSKMLNLITPVLH